MPKKILRILRSHCLSDSYKEEKEILQMGFKGEMVAV